MNPARCCVVLFSRDLASLCVSTRKTSTVKNPIQGLCLTQPRYCQPDRGGGGRGGRGGKRGDSGTREDVRHVTQPPMKPASRASSPTSSRARSVSPMGSSSSRLFGTLAQTLSSGPLAKEDLYPGETPSDPESDPEGSVLADPDQLLRECEEALVKRPARPHRDLVYPALGQNPCSHNRGHNTPIRIMQWNILAQALGEGKDGFVRCPLDALNWQERKYLILEEILTYRPDILCLQEVDHYYDTFQPIMASLGYRGSFLAKPWSPCLDVERNNGPDGCALFYRHSRFSLLATSHLRLAAMMLPTNQVAIAQTLHCRDDDRRLCVAVTHLKARSGWERLRSAQGGDLLQNLRRITSRAAEVGPAPTTGSVPLIVCGDFNAEPSEDVYRRFSTSPLGLDSAYKLLSADGQTEPAYTTWKIRPSGESCSTLDYIWYTRSEFRVEALLNLPTEEQIGPDRLPSYHYPSDHLSLLCDISFREQPRRMM